MQLRTNVPYYGKTLWRRLIFDNAIEGFEKLLTQVRAVQVAQGLPKVVFGVEPTANYHKPLGEHLIKCGRMVVLVSGVAVKRNRELLDGRWDKHDTKDAANIADLISQGKCLFYDYPEMELRNLRTLLSLKKKLKKQEHSYRVRIRNHLLAQYFPELDRFSGRPEVEAIVRWCLDPSELAGLEFDPLVQRVVPGRKTLPGFGPDISAQVIGALGNPFRFQNRKQVLKLAGLDLSADRSGKTSDAATPVISKKGKADLRYALYQAAFIASTRYRPWIEKYTDQLQGRAKEPGIRTKRCVKLSAKFLIIAWTIMKKKEPYNPRYLNPA